MPETHKVAECVDSRGIDILPVQYTGGSAANRRHGVVLTLHGAEHMPAQLDGRQVNGSEAGSSSNNNINNGNSSTPGDCRQLKVRHPLRKILSIIDVH